MESKKALDFLERHGMAAQRVNPAEAAVKMCASLQQGLEKHGEQVPMIATYLSNDGVVPLDSPAIVIDAGGTNFRRALITFTENGAKVEELWRSPMPGIKEPVEWDEFISFVADSIMPIIDRTDKIGFCFSYTAEITPEIDGRVVAIDKEVVVNNCKGKLVGESLSKELERRGKPGKRVLILNDTVAVLLGGSAVLDKSCYSGFIGQVRGTGPNTCCSLPMNSLVKLGRNEAKGTIVNLESGLYDGIAQGDFDLELDAQSNVPGNKLFEKMTAGVYLGELCRMMLKAAAKEGLLSADGAEKAMNLDKIDSAVIDAWSVGENLSQISEDAEDAAFVQTVSRALFERSARCMCTNILAIMMLTGEGKDREKPVCVCAEGSLVQKSHCYLPMLEQALDEYAAKICGHYAVMKVGYETTMPGSAAAALLN